VIGHDTPVIGHDTPVTGHDTPVIGHDTPVIGHDKPVTGHDTPVIGHDTPVSLLLCVSHRHCTLHGLFCETPKPVLSVRPSKQSHHFVSFIFKR
jgi:hypothetical protein